MCRVWEKNRCCELPRSEGTRCRSTEFLFSHYFRSVGPLHGNEHVLTEKQKKEIASLSRRKNRERLNAFLLEGVRSVEAAIAAKADLLYLITLAQAASAELRADAESLGAAVAVLSERELARLSDVQTSQGILAVARRRLIDAERLMKENTVLLLCGVQDPGNVGTLLRTAAWFGVGAVIAGPDTADFYNTKVVRASMGGIWDLRLSVTDDVRSWLNEWQIRDNRIYAADLEGTNIDRWKPTFPSVMIIGSEAHGVSVEIAGLIDERIHIPGPGSLRITESLNAAVAGGLVVSSWMNKASPDGA